MSRGLRKPDASGFGRRLNAALDARGGVPPLSDGRGLWVAQRYKVKPPSAHAWLHGQNLARPEYVRVIARDCGVTYDWLYFGEGAMMATAAESPREPLTASQPAIPDPSILREAYLLAYQEAEIETGVPYRLEDDPQRTVSAYAFLVSGRSASEVAEYMGAALRRRDQKNRGKSSGKRKAGGSDQPA